MQENQDLGNSLNSSVSFAVSESEFSTYDSRLATLPEIQSTAQMTDFAGLFPDFDLSQSEPYLDDLATILEVSNRISLYLEGNDTLEFANSVNLSSDSPQYEVDGLIGDNIAVSAGLDVDLFSVELSAGSLLSIDVDANEFGSSLDSVLRVFDDAGNELAWSDDSAAPGETPSYDSYLDFSAPTEGTYYVGVSGFGNFDYDPTVAGSGAFDGSTGDYSLIFTYAPSDLENNNDTFNTAIATALTYDSAYQAEGTVGNNTAIAPGLDVDLYAVDLVVGDHLTVDIDADATGTGLDAGLRLFDASGNEFGFSDDTPAPDEAYSFDPYLDFVAAQTGTYYVGVSGFGNYDYDPTIMGSGLFEGSTGDYTLEMTRSVMDFEATNDTLDTATVTGLTASNAEFQVSGRVGDNALFMDQAGLDVDVYSFYLNAGDEVAIDIDANTLDSGLRLFDASGNEIAWSDNAPAPGEFFSYDPYLEFTATDAGMYFLGVSGYANYLYNPHVEASGVEGNTGAYDLSIDLTPYAYETNDLITQAIALGSGPEDISTVQLSGVIGDSPNLIPSNDVDFFTLQMETGDLLTVDVDAFENGTWLDSGLRIFDADGNELAFSDDAAAPEETLSFDPYLEFSASTTGNYYIAISGYGNFDYNPFVPYFTTTPGSTGAYDVTFSLTSTTHDVLDEINDTLTQATITGLSPGSPDAFQHAGFIGDNPTIDPGLDVDMFSVQMGAGDTLLVDIDADETGSWLDAGLRLFDAYGNELSFSDDNPAPDEGFSFDPYLEFVAAEAGNYFIGVSGYSNYDYNPFQAGSGLIFGSTGDYSLEMTLVPATVTPDAVDSNFSGYWGYGLVDTAAAIADVLGTELAADIPDLGGENWGLDMVNAPEVWAQGYTGEGIVVAVLDTGVDYTHSDLDDNIWINTGEIAGDGIDNDGNGFTDDVFGWDFVSDDNDAMDGEGHGTHVAGTIAAENNGYGVTGVAYNAEIMPVRVIGDWLEQDDYEYLNDIASGIHYAVDNGADVINMSLGYHPAWYGGVLPSEADAVEAAIQYASEQGTVVVMAAGNGYAFEPGYPAIHAADWGMAVGAVDSENQIAWFSNYAGSEVLDYVVAPGVDVYSTVPGESYDWFDGTSMASPHVAGAVALLMEAAPDLSASAVEDALTGTANPVGITA